jgi:predicted metal-dependent phosphoesterase TrpH
MIKYDFHTHSKYSLDGSLDPELMVKAAIKKGLAGMAITDHNSIKGGLKAKKYETDEFRVIVGSEISTDRGEVIGLFLSEEIESKNFRDVIEEIRDQNGVVVIPHPFDKIRPASLYPHQEDSKFIDNLEVFNSRCLLQGYNEKAAQFADNEALNIIGGSDAHFLGEIGNGGAIIESDDTREAVIKGDLRVFGRRSSVINLGLTEMVKLWRMVRYRLF